MAPRPHDQGSPRENPATAPRIQGLDLWRAILAIAGLVRHAADWHVGNPVFDTVILISASFRMGAFFCISGLLTGYALLRHPPGTWIRRRTRQLGVPMLFGLIVLCPLISLVVGWTKMQEGQAFTLDINWYHIWFLPALLLYSFGAVGLHRLDEKHGIVHKMVARLETTRAVCLICGSLAFAAITAMGLLVHIYAPAALIAPLSQFRWIAGYAPLFFLGFAISRSDQLRREVPRQTRLASVIIVLIGIAYAWSYGVLYDSPAGLELRSVAHVVGTSLGPLAVSILIFRSAFKIERVPYPLRVISEGAFTIYLVHLPYLAIAHAALTMVDWGEYTECLLAITASGALSMGTHLAFVRRSSTAAFLLNGRMPGRRGTAMAGGPSSRS
jgi:glucan biosynthesis protein C